MTDRRFWVGGAGCAGGLLSLYGREARQVRSLYLPLKQQHTEAPVRKAKCVGVIRATGVLSTRPRCFNLEARKVGVLIGLENRDGVTPVGVRLPQPPRGY